MTLKDIKHFIPSMVLILPVLSRIVHAYANDFKSVR